MNPTPQQIQAIKTFVGGLPGTWAKTDTQIRAAMQTTLVNNPVTAAPVLPKPFKPADILGVLSDPSKTNLKTFTGLGSLLADIQDQDIERCQVWAGFLAQTGIITTAERTAILGVVNATRNDPTWSVQVPWDIANLGRPADDLDIEAGRTS